MLLPKFINHFLLLSVSILLIYSCQQESEKSYLKSPFTKLDTLSTNDWWKRGVSKIIDMKVERDKVIAFGIYTTSNNILKLSAQLFPLYPKETRSVTLAIYQNDRWEELQTQEVNELGWSAQFRIENWDMNQSFRYKLLHGPSASFEGLIRKDPINKKEIKLAALSCNSNKDRGDRENYVNNINALDPDLIFFAGDQSYDHKEHTAAWLKFGLQFREVFRTRPAITIPDDHDIGQGNLWGENGKKSLRPDGNDGGYFFHTEYVKMVERAQTSHLPDPFHKEPLEQGITSYFTNLVIGGIDFAIIEDRKFKSGPNGKIPQQGPRADHILNPDYNPDDINLPELKLLGDLQLNFLNQWAQNKDQNRMKAVLSATGFCGGAHLHGKQSNRLHADLDSNGWPQHGRDKALELIKKAGAIHIAGDQHLPTLIKHGITEFDDGPWAFVVPAIVNDYYSRWWWPEDEKPGKNANDLLPWTGQYLDGFNNKITMHAYANPDSDSNGSGFGLIRFDTTSNEVTFECWPRNIDVTNKDAKQFLGWPLKVKY
jgi:hypothetical protein|tara:strand:+ start:1601 stop:3223 length:1623 start_codon:yes stop_codon:yes gene_type:complete